MTSIGWEFFGIKFSMFVTMVAAVIMFLNVWLLAGKNSKLGHVDNMAGDEGED
jgi:hypothetical protein